MPLFQNSLSDLIVRTLRVPLQSYLGGTATGGASAGATLIDTTGRTEADAYFENTVPCTRVRIVTTTDGAAPIGNERRVLSSTCTTNGTITPVSAFAAIVEAGDTYALLTEYTWAELKDAINMAIDEVADRALIPKMDETTVVLQADVSEYPVPSGFTHIYRLTQAEGTGQFLYPIPPDQYRINLRLTIPYISFYAYPPDASWFGHYCSTLWAANDLVDDRVLRIEGFGRQPKLVADSDLCWLNPNYICFRAAQMLHSARITHAAGDFDAHRVKATECGIEVAKALPQTIVRVPHDCKKVEW